MKYKILSKHFGYSKPNEYIHYLDCNFKGQLAKTNRDVLDIYNWYKCSTDIDLMVILEIDYDIIELNQKLKYSIFKKDEELYTLLICLNTEKEYNDYLKSYSGDLSELFLAEIIKNELSDKR